MARVREVTENASRTESPVRRRILANSRVRQELYPVVPFVGSIRLELRSALETSALRLPRNSEKKGPLSGPSLFPVQTTGVSYFLTLTATRTVLGFDATGTNPSNLARVCNKGCGQSDRFGINAGADTLCSDGNCRAVPCNAAHVVGRLIFRSELGCGGQSVIARCVFGHGGARSEEHTSELQSLMRISYAVFCLKQKKK